MYRPIAKAVIVAPMYSFLTGAWPIKVSVKELELLDVTYWSVDSKAMVVVTLALYIDVKGDVIVRLLIVVHRIDLIP